jgi:transcriptional regulator with XRE-family HTH domain
VKERELGEFLRARREALTPEQVGLPHSERRRTPGLRRAELATLANVSVDYLARIEQGRDTNPSAKVIAALADALRLTEADRGHLRLLVAAINSQALCPSEGPAAQHVRDTVRVILDRLQPTPAYVVNHLFDVLAWTETYEQLARPLGILDARRPNLIRYTFTDPRARTAYPDWSAVADAQVAELRARVCGPGSDVERLSAELAELAGAAFEHRWRRAFGTDARTGVHLLTHPEAGQLRLNYETLELPDPDRQRLVILLPATPETELALAKYAPARVPALAHGR